MANSGYAMAMNRTPSGSGRNWPMVARPASPISAHTRRVRLCPSSMPIDDSALSQGLSGSSRSSRLRGSATAGAESADSITERIRTTMHAFTKLVLYTERDGRAKWREEAVPLGGGNPQAMLSELFPASGYQLRHSPPGFRSQWHCTPQAQWVFILGGEMEIGLQDKTS